MDYYQKQILSELTVWQKQMLQHPSLFNWLSKEVQLKINTWIPEKVHQAITTTIKQMIRGVLFGATHTTANPLTYESLQACEVAVLQKIETYRTTAAVEGGITGAGGILLGLADFPILIGIKLKLLFDISSTYGFNVADYKERVYLLHIFELAFSSHVHRRKIYLKMVDWDQKSIDLPEDIHQFDWRNFQQEYRDYIDLAKMAQLIPIIGAPVGFVVNSRLIKKLGLTAMNAYRMRLLNNDLNLKHF
ncbi:MAG TPA: ABC transporter-associated protein EcsC [Prolixibacteraceae bacterium]|nr:ABC transporter-associated protein EcsC [Prolixibacteraceae bacterium]